MEHVTAGFDELVLNLRMSSPVVRSHRLSDSAEDMKRAAELLCELRDMVTTKDRELLLLRAELTAARWNLEHPIGAVVRYWTGARDGAGRTSRTRSTATVLSSGPAVVWVEGQAACIALSHVEAIVDSAEK